MMQLITVVMAISLTAMVLGTGINHVSTTVMPRREATIYAESGFNTFATAVTAYRIANGSAPYPVADNELPPSLVPTYIEAPRAPERMTWKYGYDAASKKYWVCLTGEEVTEAQWDGLEQAYKNRPSGTAGLVWSTEIHPAKDCGDFSKANKPNPPSLFPVKAYLTFQVFQ